MTNNPEDDKRREELRNRSRMDQATATITDLFPPVWAGLYHNLIEKEVPADHATQMVCAYIHASIGNNKT